MNVLLRIELREAEGRKAWRRVPHSAILLLYCTQSNIMRAIILTLMGNSALDGRVVCRLPLTLLWAPANQSRAKDKTRAAVVLSVFQTQLLSIRLGLLKELSEEDETCRYYLHCSALFFKGVCHSIANIPYPAHPFIYEKRTFIFKIPRNISWVCDLRCSKLQNLTHAHNARSVITSTLWTCLPAWIVSRGRVVGYYLDTV